MRKHETSSKFLALIIILIINVGKGSDDEKWIHLFSQFKDIVKSVMHMRVPYIRRNILITQATFNF